MNPFSADPTSMHINKDVFFKKCSAKTGRQTSCQTYLKDYFFLCHIAFKISGGEGMLFLPHIKAHAAMEACCMIWGQPFFFLSNSDLFGQWPEPIQNQKN